MFDKRGIQRLSTMFLALAFVAGVVGAVFKFSPLGRADGPPSFNPGASLFQGKLSVEKVAYYYSGVDTNVEALMQCLGGSSAAGMVYYHSGDGFRNEGYYYYNLEGVDDEDGVKIEDPGSFALFKGRMFGLIADGAVDSNCALPATKFSGFPLAEVVGNFGSGWVMVAADSPNLSEVMEKVKGRALELWVQDGVNSFREIKMEELDKEFFTGYYGMWIKFFQA